MASAGFPTADLPLRTLVAFTIIVELSGATAIILGWKTRSAAVAVFLFTAAATLLFHRFWDAAPGDAMVQQLMFMKNVSVMVACSCCTRTARAGTRSTTRRIRASTNY